jgi:protein PhnA
MSDHIELRTTLRDRAGDQCELCTNAQDLDPFAVTPFEDDEPEHNVLLCATCRQQINGDPADLDTNHWYGLQETIWSETQAVQALSWRILHRLRGETWARDLLDQAYLTDEVLEWAKHDPAEQEQPTDDSSHEPITRDSNGTELKDGDSVTLIRDLDVKGTSFVAKQGTKVDKIRLIGDPDNIEGKINNIMLVLKTKFLKKA